jgi:hypothetical protein
VLDKRGRGGRRENILARRIGPTTGGRGGEQKRGGGRGFVYFFCTEFFVLETSHILSLV